MDRSAPLLLVKLRTTSKDEFRVVSDSVLSFVYTDAERKADSCKITVDNSDLSHFDDPIWRKGSTLIVQWGYPGRMSPAREVVVTSVKGFRTLTVEANAKSVVMNRRAVCRTFEGMTISQIATQIANENGFSGEAIHVDATADVLDTVTQSRLTDAQFLRRWASRIGFEFFVDFDGFHFHERKLGAQPIRVFRYHTDPGMGDIIGEPTIENDITAKPGRVRVRGRNPLERTDIDEHADNNTDTDRDVLAPLGEIIDQDTGDSTMVPERELASEDIVATPDPTPEAATTRARARFRRAQQTAVKMKFPIVGDPLVVAKSIVQVEGMGRRLSIRYYLQEVTHDLSKSGYKCDLTMVSDGHGGHSTDSSRVQGLGAFAISAQARVNTRDTTEKALSDALSAARDRGDTSSAATIERALRSYRSLGPAASAQVAQDLNSVTRNQEADPEVRATTAQIANAIRQSGAEPENRGRQNDRNAPDSEDGLAPVSHLDPDTGDEITTFDDATRVRSL